MGYDEHERPEPVPHRLSLQAPLGVEVYPHHPRQGQGERQADAVEHRGRGRELRLVVVPRGDEQARGRHHQLGRQEAGILLLQGRWAGHHQCRQAGIKGDVLPMERRVQRLPRQPHSHVPQRGGRGVHLW